MKSEILQVPVRSVRKALDLLELLAFREPTRDGVPLTVLAERMGMPANTTRNLLKTMIVCGFVVQQENSSYTVGPKCLQLGRWSRFHDAAARARIETILRTLSSDLQEAVVLAALRDGRRVIVSEMNHAQPVVKVDSTMLPEVNLYDLPTGRILAAYAGRDEWQKIVAHYGWPRATWNDIVSESRWTEASAALRKAGMCIVLDPRNGLAAFSVPVLDDDGNCISALGCYAPMYRCGKARRTAILRRMRAAAADLAVASAE
ncbi:MAG: helix-turn-helix domain-containing protein [Kiritimatiellae bacterium]|nr:helix-turn-helix domain-containing protein [Kiritimatiellia bacterium]